MQGKEMDEKWIVEEKSCEEQIFDTDTAVKTFNKIVIVGAPGSGKTTLLKHVALTCCKENLKTHTKSNVPIFITLRQFLESGKPLREYINDVFEQYQFPKAGEFIEEDLEEGRCHLLFDGFDELATVKRQQIVTAEIEDFVRTYHKNRFIVTSRIAGYHGELKGFETLEVLEFDDQQIEQFITNWFGEVDAENAKIMNKTIKNNEKIHTIAHNPLMVSITALVHEEEQNVPQRKVELYECCVEVLLERWDVVRKIKNRYDEKAKEKILRKLALKAHISKKRSFTREELLKTFRRYLPGVKIKKNEAENVLDEIVQRNVLLKEI
jgi:predicted NACHT family NTPase